MTNYEVMFIVKATLDEASIKKIAKDVEKILIDSKAKVIEFKEMGRKKLAYEINKEVSGFYYLINVSATHDTIREFDRKLRINENIIRHLILKKESE